MKLQYIALLAACLSPGDLAAAFPPAPPIEALVGSAHDLTAFKLKLSRSLFTALESGSAPIGDWQVERLEGNARELYLGVEPDNPSSVNVHGLVDNKQRISLSIFPVAGASLARSPFTVEVDLDDLSNTNGARLLSEWSAARRRSLIADSSTESGGGLLRPMLARSGHLYESIDPLEDRSRLPRQREGRDTNGFSLLSGEAAIEETLQRQLLQTRGKTGRLTHAVRKLTGPKIRSHAFSDVLAGREVQTPPIVSLVPHDRYLVHIDDLGAALQWLDQSAATGFELIGLKLGVYVKHRLVDRYLSRLHFSRPLVEQLAFAGVIGELALFGPDLYLQHGSELTVVLKTEDLLAASVVFAPLLGVGLGDTEGDVRVYGAAQGEPAYFARHGQWLIFSTSEQEARAALALSLSGGEGSLGKSDEFQYMYSLLPPEPGVQGLFVYLSDPFIRSMVGPRTKIRQLRRHNARARLSMVTASQLLHQLDYGEPASLQTLVTGGYVEPAWLSTPEGDRMTIDGSGRVQSSLYGRLDNMVPLSRIEVDRITRAEKAGYEDYVTEYSRYWSQFFDPIGVRVSVSDPLKVETVILPLVENSIYLQLRELVGGEPADLKLPHYTPEPVTLISFKLPPDQLPGSLEDKFGDGVHIALYDSSPLIGLGSTDLIGGFSSRWLRGGPDWFLWGAVLAPMLTQPTAIFVELDPSLDLADDVCDFVGTFIGLSLPFEDQIRLDRLSDTECVFTLSFEHVVRLHVYFSLVDDYLVVSNHRLGLTPLAGEPERLRSNASVRVHFDEIRQLRKLLDLHQLQHAQTSAIKNAERLLPFFMLGADDVDEAIDMHEHIFGTRPLPPAGSKWHWNPKTRQLENDRFGDRSRPRLPSSLSDSATGPGAGLFEGLDRLSLDFRFEDDGIRISLLID